MGWCGLLLKLYVVCFLLLGQCDLVCFQYDEVCDEEWYLVYVGLVECYCGEYFDCQSEFQGFVYYLVYYGG